MRYLMILLLAISLPGKNQTLVPGTISAIQETCTTCMPAKLTSTPPNGTSPTYQWKSAPSYSGTYTDISGETNASYQPPALTASTFYVQLQNSTGTTGGPLPTNVININVGIMRYASNLENSFEMDRKCYNAPKTMTINNYNILEGRVIIVAGQNIIITNTTITPMSYFHAYIRSSIKAVNRVTQTTVKKMNGVTKTDLMRVNGVNNY